MRTTTGLSILLPTVMFLGGCTWVEKNVPWLAIRQAKAKDPVPVTAPSHEAVLRPQDGIVLEPTAEVPETVESPAAEPPVLTEPVPEAPAPDPPAQPQGSIESVSTDVAPVRPEAPAPLPETQPVLAAGPSQADVDISIDDFTPPEPPEDRVPETQPVEPPAPQPPDAVPANREVVAASMVQVNDRYVTIEDVSRGLGSRVSKLPTTVPEATYRRQVAELVNEEVRRQVTQELVLGEATDRLTDPQKASIDSEMSDTLREMIATLGEGSRNKLQQELLRQGTTLEDVLAEQRKHLTVRLYLRARFSPMVNVTRQMLWDYYKAHGEQFESPKKVQVQMIVVPLAPGADAPAKAQATATVKAAIAELQQGRDFADVAKRYSRGSRAQAGGLWDLMPEGSLREKRVEDVAFQLKEGQMAGPIETTGGLYVVRAVKVVPPSRIEFVDAQDRIDAALREEQFQRLTEEYFRDLVSHATIRQNDQFTRLAEDRIVNEYYKPQR